ASTTHQSIALPAVRTSRAMGWLWPVVAAVLGVAAAGLAWIHFRVQPIPAQPMRFQIPPPAEIGFADLSSYGPAVISPDGSALLFPGTDKEGKIDLYLRPLNSIAARKLEGTRDSIYPFWSPDSKQIAFFQSGKLMKLAVAGGVPLPICDAPNGRGGDWTVEGGEQGMIVFAPGVYSPIMLVPAVGGVPKPVTKLDKAGKGRSHRQPTFLPGGRRFLYLALTNAGEIPVMSASVDGGAPTELFTSSSRVTYVPPAQAGDPGLLLLVRDGNLVSQRIAPDTLQLTGDPIAIAPKVGVSGNRQTGDFSVSRNGILVFRDGGGDNGTLTWLDRQGKQLKMLPERSASQNDLRIGNTGRRAAYDKREGGNSDIWTMDLEREVTSRHTFEPRLNGSPVWSPDDRQMAYVGGDLMRSVFLRATDGSGARNLLATMQDASLLRTTDWSRDGRFLLLTTIQKSGNDLSVLPAGPGDANRQPIPLLQTQFNEADARFSPDGRWIVYSSDESGSNEVYVRPFDGQSDPPKLGEGKWQISSGGGVYPQWRADGKELFYYRTLGTMMAAAVKPGAGFAFDPPKELFSAGISAISATADGQRFLMVKPEREKSRQPLEVVLHWREALMK
ncbi:MAG: PD40 domain-containing protein, partial [Acidobacteriia bacterium]|nr:PD40 domain-containing protein [Terriglobia bacterium]